MLMFTLVISCLTTSKLPWFMDLTFQVPKQCCSLQHWTLLPSPVTSTTGIVFTFSLHLFILAWRIPGTEEPGGLPSLGLHRVGHDWKDSNFILSRVISPLFSSSILGTYWPGEFIFQCHIFLPSLTVHGVLKARILKWFAIPFSSGPRFVRTLHYDPSTLGGHTRHGS